MRDPILELPAGLADAFDLGDPRFIHDPYPVLAEIRATTPLLRNPATGQWVVTRHATVHELLRDRRLGRVFTHRFTHAELGRPEPDPRWAAFDAHERWSLLQLEPPDHTRIRRLITKVFTPTAIDAVRPAIEARAAAQAAEARERGRFDLIADVAQPFSVGVICSMLGVPEADATQLLAWSHAIVKMYELTTTEAQKVAATQAATDFMAYVADLIAAKRRSPDGLLVSDLAAVEDAGDRLGDDEIISTVIVLLNAGHEATVNTLGNGIRALMHHPGQWHRLVSGAVDPRTAVEELLRFDAPLQLFERFVLDPGVVVAGVEIPVGDEIAMLFGSANRDPARFPDPTTFDVGRSDAGHVGFGGGIHFCIGAPLARTEIAAALGAIVRAMPTLALAAEPTYHPTFVIRGLQALELTV
jgi:cytochrome P450